MVKQYMSGYNKCPFPLEVKDGKMQRGSPLCKSLHSQIVQQYKEKLKECINLFTI